MLKTKLIQMQHDKEELMTQVSTLEGELVAANEYKDNFKKSSYKLDDMLKSQKPDGETIGLGFEHGESSGTTNNHDHNKLVRQPNAYKFNGKCFNCNKFGHTANQWRYRNNQNTNLSIGQYSKCNKHGHNSNNCRINVKCYACGRFGHLSNQCRTQTGQGYGKAIQRNNVTCYACNNIGHIARFCGSKNVLTNDRGSNDKGKEKVNEIKQEFSKQWVEKRDQRNDESSSTPVE